MLSEFCPDICDCVIWFCTLPIDCGLILYITYRLCGLLSFHLNQQMRVPKYSILQHSFNWNIEEE
jgi:hypothetical protein